VSFSLNKKFDLIISISTMEHVGSEDDDNNPSKIFATRENLRKHLKEGGEIFMTLPVSQNPALDRYIASGQVRFKRMYYLKRVSRSNRWVQVDDVKGIRYDHPYPHANGLAVCEDD